MDGQQKTGGSAGWRDGRVLGPAVSNTDKDAASSGSFRTLETPGALVPDIQPAPWSFHPGLPAGAEVESAHFTEDGFVLQFRSTEGTQGSLRCRVTGSGQIAGETDLAASPSLFSPTQDVAERDGAWLVETPGHVVVLVTESRDQGIRFALAWGGESADILRTAASDLLTADLPLPETQAQDKAAAAEEDAEEQAPSAGAQFLHRHGGRILAVVGCLLLVLIVWGIADARNTGQRNESDLVDLARKLNRDGRYDEALAVVEAAETGMGPGAADMVRAGLQFRRGDYAEAAATYRQALEEGADPDAATLNLAASLFRAGQWEEAKRIYQEFVDTRGEAVPAHVARAKAALSVMADLEGTLPPKNVGH